MQTSKRIINGIKNIDVVVEGIYNYNNEKPKIEKLALKRSKTCDECIYKKDELIKSLQVDDRIESLKNKMCDLCGCVLSYKLRTKIITTKKCPLNNE